LKPGVWAEFVIPAKAGISLRLPGLIEGNEIAFGVLRFQLALE
jgi:hypothetical protein